VNSMSFIMYLVWSLFSHKKTDGMPGVNESRVIIQLH